MKYLDALKFEDIPLEVTAKGAKSPSCSSCSSPERDIQKKNIEIIDIATRRIEHDDKIAPCPLTAMFQGRAWTKGNPFTCITCGHPTGWTTGGSPLCPCCVPPDDEKGYRRRLLAFAREIEEAAGAIVDPDKKATRLAVVVAIREEFTK